jgi:23S rRNA pseudouridine1911/1915/1917 synthase
MADRVVLPAAGPLLDVLAAALPTWSRNTLRQRLRLGCIAVNGAVAGRGDQAVNAGDVVTIDGKLDGRAAVAANAADALPVLFVDDHLCAIDKPAGLLSVASDDDAERTALARLRRQLGGGDLWPAHRLDRETSGVLLFARTRAARDAVQDAWNATRKEYVAIVAGHPQPPEGIIEQPLWEDANLRVRVGSHPEARPARTRYRTLARGPAQAQLAVELDTGRKHQIRAHLAWLGHAVLGDDRYGARAPRLFLHAHRLTLRHPSTGAALELVAAVPPTFAPALAAKGSGR